MQTTRILNEKQTEAVRHEGGPLLIIAGAGTGKTTVITERIKFLVLEKNIPPSDILALTFTEKAAKEMQERVDVALPYGYSTMWISTFHAFCDRVLRNEAAHIGLTPSYKLMTESESILFLRKHLFALSLSYFRPLGNPTKFLEGLLQHFSRLKDEDVTSKEYLKYVKGLKKEVVGEEEFQKNQELANAFVTYEEIKTKEGVLDFSDLIVKTLELFRRRPNLLRLYEKQFQHVLVDEFQDTNYSQNMLAILLSGERKKITVVGDDDQAIYRWRGAAISNMIQFKKTFKDAKIVTLTENYRSTTEILLRSYDLIQFNNPDRLETKEHIHKKLTSARKEKGEPIEFLFGDRVEDEASQVAENIVKLKKEGYLFNDVAILIRANDHAMPFIRAFERTNIPYQFLGPGRLFHREEIKELIAYLKILANFEDSSALYKVLAMPIFGLQSIELASLLNLSKKKNYSLFESLEKVDETFLNDGTKKKIADIVSMIKRHLILVPKETAGQILFHFLEDTGSLKQLIETKTEKQELVAKNIAKFFDKLKTYEVEHEDASVFAVTEWIDLAMLIGESPLATDTDWSDNNAVNILTIHSSKGLEFPVVFLVNLVRDRFPTRDRREQIPIPQALIKEVMPEGDYHMQEERRLFYVGMTRARDRLFLTAAKYYGEGKRERKISPFIYEALGEKMVEEKQRLEREKELIFQPSLLDWKKPEDEVERISSPQKITYLSYSQIQTFGICPMHYKLKYLLKIPVPQTSAQSYGTSIHSTLRDFFQKLITGEKPDGTTIKDLLVRNWINEGYTSKEHELRAKEQAANVISRYVGKNLTQKTSPLALEYPFQFFIEGLKVGGRIDRIDQKDERTIEIIDYKTGNNVPSQRELDQDLQLTFYALAAMEVKEKFLNKKPENVLLSLHYLEKDTILTTTRTLEQLQRAKEYIIQKAQEIGESTFLCSANVLCTTCEYKMLCSLYPTSN